MNNIEKRHNKVALGGALLKNDQNPYLTTKSACMYLNVSARHLFDLRSKGLIKYYQMGKTVRFKQIDIDAYVEEHAMETFNCKGGAKHNG